MSTVDNDTVIDRLEHLENKVMHFCIYQWGCNQALTQMMQALALHIGVDMYTFLTLPTDTFDTTQQDARASARGDIEDEEEEEEEWYVFQWIEGVV